MRIGEDLERKNQMTKIVANANFNTNDSDLFVLIGTNRLYYFISNNNQVVIQESISLDTESLEVVLKRNFTLNNDFKQVKVGFFTPYSTLVPNILYQESASTTYLENSFRVPHQHYLLTDNINCIQCQNIYLVPVELYNILQQKFPNVTFFNVSTTLLSSFHKESLQFDEPSVFINIYGNFFQASVFEKGKLLLSNTYEFMKTKDFVYFTLLIFNQLELNVEQTKLFISGELMKSSEIYNLIYRYVRHINFMERTTALEFDEAFVAEPRHFYYDLYSLFLDVKKVDS